MTEDNVAEQSLLSERLAQVQDSLRGLLDNAADQGVIETLEAAAHEIGMVRLILDTPRPGARRAHMRVPETIGTALLVDGREVDAAIVDISVGGVGLITDERLPAGTRLKVAVPPVGWIEAEVVAGEGDRLHLRFHAGAADGEQQRALLDLVLRHYD